MADNCIFCKIIAGTIPSFKDEKTISFLDVFPMTEGHVLVVPKKHCVEGQDLPEEDGEAVFRTISKVSKSLSKQPGVTGWNLVSNNGPDAGQAVFHVHYHLIPRRADDGLIKLPPSAKVMLTPEAGTKQLEAIKAKLN